MSEILYGRDGKELLPFKRVHGVLNKLVVTRSGGGYVPLTPIKLTQLLMDATKTVHELAHKLGQFNHDSGAILAEFDIKRGIKVKSDDSGIENICNP